MHPNPVLVVVGSICACFSYCLALRDVVFVQEPQNRTIFNLKEPFFFNCSTDVASNDGMDWLVRIGERRERICASNDFPGSCQLNYSMEVPNNRTLNLIVDPRIARLGNEYCCQFDNGAGKRSCSYLTISLTVSTDPALTDITTAFPHKNNTASEESPTNGVSTGLIAGIIIGIVGITLAAIIVFWKKRRDSRRMRGESRPTGSSSSAARPASPPPQPPLLPPPPPAVCTSSRDPKNVRELEKQQCLGEVQSREISDNQL